uniref:Uncharacterized protein n=1 Tax=Caenorhabditis japonica TaxID=281687 RepID=A0A8R1IQ74_CAEJA
MPRTFSADFLYQNRPDDVSNAAEKAENADSIGTEMEGIEEQSDCDFIAHGALEEDEDSNGTNQSADEEIPELKRFLKSVPTDVLQFIASCCLSRLSTTEFERFLTCHTEDFANLARNVWNYNRCTFSTHFFCNDCGRSLSKSERCKMCPNSCVAHYLRMGGFAQVCELVDAFLHEILKLRTDLKSGAVEVEHNLNSPFFSHSWKSEGEYFLNLSLLMSVDGVDIPGTKNKIWPVCFSLIDLPRGLSQKSTNIILQGVVQCLQNPTTALWNALLPMICVDLESQTGKCAKYKFRATITTCTADQPAKRSLFGFKGHTSSQSCFFCLSTETLHKTRGGESRSILRRGQLTINDSVHVRNGFKCKADIVKMIYPYHTPIDTLHNLGEGFFETISKEVTGIPSNTNPKSQLFNANKNLIKNALERIIIPSVFGELSARRNGSDKIHYFRLLLGLLAITTDFLSPKARIVIAASSTIANGMYTESQGLELILDQMCAATRWFLSETSPEYMTIKTHEVLCHLPEITRLMGNTSCLSTFQFESAYKFILKGYTSSMTRGRLEHLGSKYVRKCYLYD